MPWQEEIEQALSAANAVATFIGANGIGRWQNEEMRSAINRKAIQDQLKVIPILLPDLPKRDGHIQLPDFLSRFTWCDFRDGFDNKHEYDKLISAVLPNSELLLSNIFMESRPLIASYASLRKSYGVGSMYRFKQGTALFAFITVGKSASQNTGQTRSR